MPFFCESMPTGNMFDSFINSVVNLSFAKQWAEFFQTVKIQATEVVSFSIEAHPVAIDPFATRFKAVNQVIRRRQCPLVIFENKGDVFRMIVMIARDDVKYHAF